MKETNLVNLIIWFFFAILALVMFTYSSTPSTGTVYYVSKNGNDNNSGTEAHPWLTITKAASKLKAGDTVYVRAGTYNEFVVPQNSGYAGKYITYEAYPGDKVIIDGTGKENIYPGLIEIQSKSYIRISGFRIQNYTSAQWTFGIDILGSHHIIVEKNIISKTGSSGIMARDYQNSTSYEEGNEDIIIDGNELIETNIWGYLNGRVGYEEGITLSKINNFVVRNNIIDHVYKEGINIKVGSSYGKVYRNIVHDSEWNGPGIYLDAWDSYEHDIDVYQNIVYNTTVAFGISAEKGGAVENVRLYNNIAYNSYSGYSITAWADNGLRKNIFIINNVAYSNRGLGINVQSSNIQNVIIRNNIIGKNFIDQIKVNTTSGVTIDHNLIEGTSTTTGTDYKVGDPKFVNPSIADFRLLSTSPAIDTGSSVEAPSIDFDGYPRPQGAGNDIGAFEYKNSLESFIQYLNFIRISF